MTGKNHQLENDVDIWNSGGSCKLLETANSSVKPQSICPVQSTPSAHARCPTYCGSAICKPPLLSTQPGLLWSIAIHIPKFWCCNQHWETPYLLGKLPCDTVSAADFTAPTRCEIYGWWYFIWTLGTLEGRLVQTVINISSLKQKGWGYFNDSSQTRFFLYLKLH